jgi:hypothetical protein
MHKNATKCNETIGKWCKNKHGASKIIDTFETYQGAVAARLSEEGVRPDWAAREDEHIHAGWRRELAEPRCPFVRWEKLPAREP